MSVEINWLAVVFATIASMVVGSVWYMPPTFGRMWMKLTGKTEKDMEKGGMTPIIFSIVACFVTAFILAHFTFLASSFYAADYSFLQSALITAFWAWLGFTALRLAVHDTYEDRPKKLTLLNIAHEFTTIMAMGLVIGLLKP